MDDIIKQLSAKQLAELAKQAKEQETEAKRRAKEDLDLTQRYDIFQGVLKVYDQTQMSFFIDKNPQYFRKLVTSKINARSKKKEITSEIAYSAQSTLYPCWTELEHPWARSTFRRMINGETIKIQNPETQEWEEYKFKPRVYEKMVNTVDQVDDRTFNILDTSCTMQPCYDEAEPQTCPTILKALYYSVSGNTIEWDAATKSWQCDKPENLEFMERWTLNVTHLQIGNNMLPMPIIFGGGKIGKNALFEIVFSNLLGAELVFCGTWDTVDSNFNAFKLGKVFVFIDEIPERSEWNKVKNATGSLKDYIKTKYGAEFQVDNCIAYAMGSNQTLFPLPVEDGKQMVRVSPIHACATSTFAENTVKMLNQERGENYCQQLVQSAGIDASKLTTYEIGDVILKQLLADEWQSREAAQQLMNYLHYTYKNNSHLTPLRGQDWEEIMEYKKDSVRATAEYVIEQDPKIISTHEIYEIYKVIQGERNAAMSKQIASVTENIRPILESCGYTYAKDAVVQGGIRTNIFRKDDLVRGNLRDYEEDFGRYIDDQLVNGRPMRRLKVAAPTPTLRRTASIEL